MAGYKSFRPDSNQDIKENMLDIISPSRRRGKGMSSHKKGSMESPGAITPVPYFETTYIFKDRETNQLFIMDKFDGEEYEATLTTPLSEAKIDMTALLMKMVIKPIFYTMSNVMVTVNGVTSYDVGGTEVFAVSGLVITTFDKTVTPTNGTSFQGSEECFTLAPRYITLTINGVDQYCAIAQLEGTAISLVNPLILTAKPKEGTVFSGKIGNFVYANAAVSFSNEIIFVATISGIYRCGINGSEIIKVEYIMPTSWMVPLNITCVRSKDPASTMSYLYITGLMAPPTDIIPYLGTVPGWRITNYRNVLSDFGTGVQMSKGYNGMIGVFKMAIENESPIQDTWSLVYFNENGAVDTDFKKEQDTWWAVYYSTSDMTSTMTTETGGDVGGTISGRRSTPKVYDDQGLHSVKLRKIDPANTTVQPPAAEGVSAEMLVDFNFPVDSLNYKCDKSWKAGLFIKKTEYPFIQYYAQDGTLIRNVPLFGNGFPIVANRIRYAGWTVMVETFPSEALGSGPTAIPTTASGMAVCVLAACKHIRGGMANIIDYGNYMIGEDGKVFILKTWNAFPFYTGYYSNRNFFQTYGGDNDRGACDTGYYGASCGQVDSCFVDTMKFKDIGSTTAGGIVIQPGLMRVGIRFPVSYVEDLCCGSTSVDISYGGPFGIGGGYSESSPCQTQNNTSSVGYVTKQYTSKLEGLHFLDSMTSNTAVFGLSTSIEGRKLPSTAYDSINYDGTVGRELTDLRRFPSYTLSSISKYSKTNPTISSSGINTLTFNITASDIWTSIQFTNWAFETRDFKLTPTKTFTVNALLDTASPILRLIASPYKDITCYYREFRIAGGTGTGSSLRDFLESITDGVGKDPIEFWWGVDFYFNSSIDWAIYSPVGANDFFPQDRKKWKGNYNLGGKPIYEGVTFAEGGVFTPLDALPKEIYGGTTTLGSSYTIFEVRRDVTYLFSSKYFKPPVHTCPAFFLEENQYTKAGTLIERYILA